MFQPQGIVAIWIRTNRLNSEIRLPMKQPFRIDTAPRSGAAGAVAALCLALAWLAPASGQQLTNGEWTINRLDRETVRLTGPNGAAADFGMTFRIFLATSNSSPAKTQVSGVNYNGATSWVALRA